MEIISADSMIYRYMNIGTAKPNIEERKYPHHMIDIDPDEEYNVAFVSKHANVVFW